jgi:hypothetical protein
MPVDVFRLFSGFAIEIVMALVILWLVLDISAALITSVRRRAR